MPAATRTVSPDLAASTAFWMDCPGCTRCTADWCAEVEGAAPIPTVATAVAQARYAM
ncbi:hypothetical protein ACQUSN_00790 [Streptomyces pseudogriseolus]|uniref:hypothetical protein n=1 Tax=Streptomyces pseudogriseolus TaxID=36817 RepID=UPI003FA25EC4